MIVHLGAAFLVCLVACGPEEVVPETRLSLLELFPFTESGQQLRTLDLGTPVARPYLTAGWSERELAPSGESVVWASARKSQLRFSVPQPAARRLIFRSGVFPAGRRYPRRVTVKLNGRSVGRLRLQPGWQEVAVDLPAEAQWPGRNVLELVYSVVPWPARDGRHDFPRTLAFDWVRLELQDGTVEHGPMLAADGTEVILPGGSRSSYYVRVPSNASMTFRVRGAGRGDAVVRVTLERHRSPAQTLFAGGEGMARIDLSAYAGELARISFDVPGTDPVRVMQPCIVGAGRPRDEGDDETRLSEPPRGRPNVLLYVVDTLRADHLGCYGYPRPTSPHIDALAAGALLFTDAVSQASWTRPAVASLLTGLQPYAHGALSLRDALRPGVVTLAEVLRAEGYDTAAFVTSVNVGSRLGFAQGFVHYRYLPETDKRRSVHVLSDDVNEHVFSWLKKRPRTPFLLYVHVSDPHAPYTPPPALADRFQSAGPSTELLQQYPLLRMRENPALVTPTNIAHLVNLYDAEIAFLDESFGRLVAELEDLGLYETTLIVVTSDHGEEFHEHGGFEHGRTLFQEQLLVPLILRFPGGRPGGRRVPGTARTTDIMPTVLDYLGLPIPPAVDGRSLLGSPRTAGGHRSEAFAQTSLGKRHMEALVTDHWKVVQSHDTHGERTAVYDLQADPGERQDLANEQPFVAGYGRQALAAWAAGVPREEIPGVVLDGETAERLRLLGYVE